jgi:mannose-6-phosphate isomerase-like protein (cupin superfamily)
MTLNNNLYNKNIVNKPWGEEYTIYKDGSKLAVTLVKINSGKKTSLHCHPKKKTGFIILKGKPIVQVGIHKDNKWQTKPLSILVLRPGLFHSLSNEDTLKKDVYAFEFETPYDKKDLVRFKDEYGRSEKGYENSKSFKKFDNNTLIFKNSKKKKIYNFFGRKITLQQLEHINDIK